MILGWFIMFSEVFAGNECDRPGNKSNQCIESAVFNSRRRNPDFIGHLVAVPVFCGDLKYTSSIKPLFYAFRRY